MSISVFFYPKAKSPSPQSGALPSSSWHRRTISSVLMIISSSAEVISSSVVMTFMLLEMTSAIVVVWGWGSPDQLGVTS